MIFLIRKARIMQIYTVVQQLKICIIRAKYIQEIKETYYFLKAANLFL